MNTEVFKVKGKQKLKGDIYPSGNKNEALPVIAAVLLTKEEVIIHNIPQITDTLIMIDIAKELGVKVVPLSNNSYSFKADTISNELNNELTSKIRSSLLFSAPLISRFKEVVMPSSGGDKIGKRRIDTHLLAFEKFNIKIEIDDEIRLIRDELKGSYILLDEASVMATENAVMAAVTATGETTIYNAACEPHVQGLCNMLNGMGGNIKGIGTNKLIITGVKELKGTTHTIMPDHIEVGSFIGLAAATDSYITIKNGHTEHMDIIYPSFKKIGIEVKVVGNDIVIEDNQKLEVVNDIGGKIPIISDQPWPAFPADLTSIMVVTALFSKGTVMIFEKLFESRLFFTDSLIRMGGRMVLCDPHRVVITGPSELKAIELSSPDIRAGMAMLIAAMSAEGTSIIKNVQQIDRGYEDIEKRLNAIGASIERL